MEQKYKALIYSIYKDVYFEKKMEFTQHDSKTAKILFECYDDINVPMTDIQYAVLNIRRPDGKTYTFGMSYDGNPVFEINNNNVLLILPPAALYVAGKKYEGSVALHGTDGKRLTVARFTYDVIEDMTSDTPIDETNEFPILTELIDDVTILKDAYKGALENNVNGEVIAARKGEKLLGDRLDKLDDRLYKFDSQLAEITNNIRKLKFKLNVSPWWYNTTKETIDTDIPLFKRMGVDGFTLCVHVENNGTSLYVKENLDLLLYAISEIKKVGMSVSAIKMHCLQEVFDSYSDSFEQYKTIVFQVAQKFKNLDIPYFTYLNEVPNIYNGSDIKNENLINELSTYIRNLGFKVGVTFANDLEILDTVYKYPSRVTKYDCFFRNTYTIIGYKGNKTTYQDSIYAWEQMDKVINLCKSLYPNKPFILSECGIQHYWEAFRNPALYNYPSWGTDGQGKVAELFYYGLFENKNMNSGLIDEVWMWYPEQMHYDSFYKFVNSYTNNGGVN